MKTMGVRLAMQATRWGQADREFKKKLLKIFQELETQGIHCPKGW